MIKNYNLIEEYGNNPGIYCWYINGKEIYIGESTTIF